MDVRFPRYAPALLFVVAASAACNSGTSAPTSPVVLASLQSAVSVEPRTVQPEFLHAGSCAARQPFGFRLRVIFDGRGNRTLRRLRFHLSDPDGSTTLPEIIPIPSGQEAALAPLQPVPTPGITSTPGTTIPIPGSLPLTGIPVGSGASQTHPFFLKFPCGVIPAGTLMVIADVGDASGRVDTSQLRVPVGRR
jgi:hypothetical protein